MGLDCSGGILEKNQNTVTSESKLRDSKRRMPDKRCAQSLESIQRIGKTKKAGSFPVRRRQIKLYHRSYSLFRAKTIIESK